MLHLKLDTVDDILDKHFPLKSFSEELNVKVGPIILNAKMPNGFIELLIPRYDGFLTEEEADFQIEVARSEDLDLAMYPNIVVQSKRNGTMHYVFRWDFVAKIDTSKRTAVILLSAIGSPLCVDSILRISTSFALPEKGGLLIHSAAIHSNYGGLLFCGISGSGKSTISKLSKDIREVLTDEMSLIEKVNGGYNIWGTPFWGEMQMSVNKHYPLIGVLLLQKAKENYLRDISLSEGIMEFMRTVLYFGQNLETCSKLVDVSAQLLKIIPIKELGFLPDKSLWEVLDDYFGK